MKIMVLGLALLLAFAFAASLSINDQIALRIREGENHTDVQFYALSSTYYLLFINCVPSVLLEEKGSELAAIETARIEDVLGEYIRRGYKGCNNETLDLNSSVLSVITQLSTRQIEAEGKMAALERSDVLRLQKDRWNGLQLKVHAYREVEFPVIEQKFIRLDELLFNLRRVKTRTSISRTSGDFDSDIFEAKLLLDNYGKALPYYFPAAAAYANASLAISNAKKRYGEDDPWLLVQSHSLTALDAELIALEKDLSAGFMPPPESFASVASKARELQRKAGRRGPQLPWYYSYIVGFFCLVILAILALFRLRPPRKIAEEDVPKIRSLLQKLRGIEQQEEE